MYKVLIFFFLLFSVGMYGQGITFRTGSWQEALDEAGRQGKLIFVDAYAVWCGPCKRMDQEVFTDSEVGAFFNTNFVNVKMDMEKGEGLKLRVKYSVRAYPTLLFIAADGTLVERVVGFRGAADLILAAEGAMRKRIPLEQYEAAYLGGDRSPELVYNYVDALNKTGKSSLRVANEYLRTQTDLGTDENLRFMLMAAVEADSRIFSLLEQYQTRIIALEGKEKFQTQVLKACTNTAVKATTFLQEDLLATAIAKMKTYFPERAEDFELTTSMDFYLKGKDEKNYLRYCETYVKDRIAEDPEALVLQAKTLMQHFPAEKKSRTMTENLLKMAAQQAQQSRFFLLYAEVLHSYGKTDEARKVLVRAKELAAEEGIDQLRKAESLAKKIEQS